MNPIRVLFQLAYHPSPHLETELELMIAAIDRGEEIHVLRCHGELPSCFANYRHVKSSCALCWARYHAGLQKVRKARPLASIIEHQYPLAPVQHDPQIPVTFANLDEVKAFHFDGAPLGWGIASSLISCNNRDHALDTHTYSREVAREVQTACFAYRSVKKLLQEIQPSKVYLFNGRFSFLLPTLIACEELHIPFITHERAGNSKMYWIGENTVPHDTQYAAQEMAQLWDAMGDKAPQLGAQFYLDRRARVEHSWYSYTKSQEHNRLPKGFDEAKVNISFFNTTIEEFASIRCWPKPFTVYEDEIDAVKQICSAFAQDPSVHFYFRIHPAMSGFDNTQTRRLKTLYGRYDNLTVIAPESAIDSYALMEKSSAVITFGSTMGAEATYWGKVSILLGTGYYGHMDCAYLPTTHGEVIDLLRSQPAPKPQENAMRYGLWDLQRGTPFHFYQSISLTHGTFLGSPIRPSFGNYCVIAFWLILELRSPRAIFHKIKKNLHFLT